MTARDPMSACELDAVIGRLSDNMREAICFWPKGYCDPNTVKALRRRGYIERGSLTDAGHAIRARLGEQTDD